HAAGRGPRVRRTRRRLLARGRDRQRVLRPKVPRRQRPAAAELPDRGAAGRAAAAVPGGRGGEGHEVPRHARGRRAHRVPGRGPGALSATQSAITRATAQGHPEISLHFDTMTSQIQRALLPERLMATLTGFFGGLAGLIAAIGLYGVMSYVVARRRNEIGIRMALGADRPMVLRMVLIESGVLLATGVVAGGVVSVAAAQTARALLYGLTPGDPWTFAQAVTALAGVAALASYMPAQRAAKTDPCLALRDE